MGRPERFVRTLDLNLVTGPVPYFSRALPCLDVNEEGRSLEGKNELGRTSVHTRVLSTHRLRTWVCLHEHWTHSSPVRSFSTPSPETSHFSRVPVPFLQSGKDLLRWRDNVNFCCLETS